MADLWIHKFSDGTHVAVILAIDPAKPEPKHKAVFEHPSGKAQQLKEYIEWLEFIRRHYQSIWGRYLRLETDEAGCLRWRFKDEPIQKQLLLNGIA